MENQAKQYLMPYAQVIGGSVKNLNGLDKFQFGHILAFSVSGSSGAGKTSVFQAIQSCVGGKIEKPLKNGTESGEIGVEIKTAEGDVWSIKEVFDKEHNTPVLSSKELTKNGKKTTIIEIFVKNEIKN